jgi:hypothetical protein
MGRFMDFLEVVDGIPKSACLMPCMVLARGLRADSRHARLLSAVEAEAVWHLVMPPGTRCMFKDQFVRARYILKGLSEGRAMPPNFPEHVFKERFPLPRFGSRLAETFGAPSAARGERGPCADPPVVAGTKAQPIRYDFFAYLVRPILEAEYRTRRLIYRKTSPVAVLCAADRSPFTSRPGGTELERFVLMNIGSWCVRNAAALSRSSADVAPRAMRCASTAPTLG